MVLPAILGGIASAGASFGLGKLFGGATGGSTFQPSPLMEAFGDYGLSSVKPTDARKKADLAQYRYYAGTGDRGAGEDFLRMMMDMYPQEKRYAKAFRRSLQKPVDLTEGGWDTANQIYKNAGLTFTDNEYRSMANQAERAGIRGSSAFGDFLKQNLMAQGKIMTPAQESLSLIFGAPRRTEEGYYTNDYMWNRGA